MYRVADAVTGLPQGARRLVRRLIVVRDQLPHAVLNEDVGRHVASVRDRRRDLRVAACGVERQRSMDRIVEGVNRVVRRSRVVRVLVEHLHRDGARPHLEPQRLIAECARSGQHRKRIERGHLVIVGVARIEPCHGLHVANPSFVVGAPLAPQRLDRFEEALLPVGRCLGGPRGTGRSEACEHRARILFIEIGPTPEQWVVVAQGFAPVGEGEVRFDGLGGLELLDGLLPAEAVEDRDAAQEMRLGFLRSGGRRKVERPDLRELGGGGSG